MPSDYEEIREDNIRRRGEEFDDIGRLISEQLYSDRSHFVYELLQNAEDALERRFKHNPNDSSSREVQFRLFEDKLEFRHFGVPFNEEDVKGVSDVLKGTKTEDFVQIGKFGIGFKSVYAFTASPEIHSGDEHFVIKRYIRPEQKLPKRGLEIEPRETVFIFPFDHADLSPNRAFELISNKLQELGPRVLLFLKWIEEIKWCVDLDKERGQYLKETKPIETVGNGRRVTVIGEKSEQDEDESWLIFERPVKVPDKSGQVSVEIGFRLETSAKDKKESIVRENNSRLVVYFPTEKDTRLGFLIQGPYRTTPARDNILKDDDWNRQLIEETAKLVVEALRQLKGMDLLSVSLLEALPIRVDDFPEDSMFYPIFNKVREALMNEALLPSDDRTFIAGQNAKLARSAELMKLLDQDRLCVLFQSDYEIKWLTGKISQDRTPDLRSYLRNELDADEVDPEMFARKMSEEFLAEQTDEWFIRFYKFLSGQPTLWDNPRSILRNKPILRLQDGSHVKPFQDDGTLNAFLPPLAPTDFPIVKREIASNEQARDFLKRLKLSEPDIFDDIVVKVLPKYTQPEADKKISDHDHEADIEKILRALRSDSEFGKRKVVQKAKCTAFLRAVDRKGKTAFQKPADIYFPTEKLKAYFGENADVWFLNESEREDEWQKLEVESKPRFKKIKSSLSEQEKNRLRRDSGSTEDIEISDYELDGLENFLSMFSEGTIQLERYSLILWDFLLTHLRERGAHRFYKGEYKWFYYRDKSASFDAHWQKQLYSHAWLPKNSDNVPHPPNELGIDDLPDSFHRDDELIDQLVDLLGMKQDVVGKLAEEAGVKLETLELVKQLEKDPEKLEQVRKILSPKEENQKPAFPTRPVSDPVRRENKISKQHVDAPQKEYEIRDRSVRTTRGEIDPRTYLKNQYTNDDHQMVCQICTEEMPFKKRDGEYYFEAVEALSEGHFPKELEAQFVALCPLCAAKYKEFVKGDEDAMEQFREELVGSKDKSAADELTLPLRLGEHDTSIRFVETHWKDVKSILRECG